MFIWMSLLYSVPLVVALLVAGAMVAPRINSAARSMLWLGIVLICVAQLATLATPYLVMERSLAVISQLVNAALFILRLVGTVLLIVAVARAARGSDPIHTRPPGYGYSSEPGGPVPPNAQPGYPPGSGYAAPGFQPGQVPTSPQGSQPGPSSTFPPGSSVDQPPWGSPRG